MTAVQSAAYEQTTLHAESEMCDVCGHALALHDRIAERYCDATLHAALSRACVCPTSTPPTFHY